MSEERGWRCSVRLRKEQFTELKYWHHNLPRLAKKGQLIRRPASALKVRGQKVSSDSGMYELACVWFGAQNSLQVQSHLVEYIEELDQTESSTHRELLAVRQGLLKWEKPMSGQTITWLLDNQAAVKILKWGSMKPSLMALAITINDIVERADIELIPTWKDRTSEEIQIADRLGRGWTSNIDEYRISGWQFDEITQYYGLFDTDLFASNWSARTKSFVTKEPCNKALATDAFSISWSNDQVGRVWIHPPVQLLQKVFEKILLEDVCGLALFPFWESNFEVSETLKTIAINEDRLTILSYTYLHCDSPTWRRDTTFRGYTNFPFVIVNIDPRC